MERALRRANALYSQLNQILSSPSANIPAADADIKRLCEEIRSLIRPLDEDLNDLDETIKVVQVNPGSFNLDKKDVEERKAFISATRRSMQVGPTLPIARTHCPRKRDSMEFIGHALYN